MKTIKITISILILLVFISCNDFANSDNKKNHSDTLALSSFEKYKDTKEYISHTKKLLNWYKENYDELNNIELVDLVCNDDSIHYEINFKYVKLYLLKLKKSNIFSDDYLTALNNYFGKCNKKLIDNYQSDGPPVGLEYDLILLTQEPDYLLDNIEKLDYKENMNNNCIVTIDNNLNIEFDENYLVEKIFK